MSLSLHTIKPQTGSRKKRKRIGRGNSSGSGTYSGKGQKGQKSRSGVSNLKRLGMRQMLLQIPKASGFKSKKPKNIPVNFIEINKVFKESDMVNPASLLKNGLIDTMKLPIKILAKGELIVRKLTFQDIKASEEAKKQIEKMGGKIEEKKK